MDRHPQARRAVLHAVADTPDLFEPYVLKGGLALHYVYGSPRQSYDLDFNAIGPFPSGATAEGERRALAFCHTLQQALDARAEAFGFAQLRVQHKQLLDEFPCILAEVGFTDDPEATPPFADAVEMQVTLNEVVCEAVEAAHDGIPLHVPVLEDVLAGKLKALLQQPGIDKPRSSDVFDLWFFMTQSERAIDREKVAACLRQKASKWPGLEVSRQAFHDPAIRTRAGETFEAITEQLPAGFPLPPYEAAFDAILCFVDELDLSVQSR